MIILKNAAVSPYLKPCTVTIHTGEKVALLGASGAGKTTLMRLMCGWLTPTSGDVIAPPVGEFAYVPQDLDASLNPAMRVGDIITEPVAIANSDMAAAVARIPELLRTLGLPADAAGRFPRELSGGQRQRVGIARALIAEPIVVYADEALSALDHTARELVIELFQAPGMTTILVSHDLPAAEKLSDRCIIMADGGIVEDISSSELWDRTNASPARAKLIEAFELLHASSMP